VVLLHFFILALIFFENRLIFDEVKAYKMVPVFGPLCRLK